MWKCEIVGLAFFWPGFLLLVDGSSGRKIRTRDNGKHLRDVILDVSQLDHLTAVKRIRDPESWDGGSSNFVQNLKANDGVPQALALQQHSGDAGAGSESAHGGPFVLQSVEFIVVVAGCAALAAVGIITAGVCWYKYSTASKAARDVEYPAYSVTGPTKDRLPSPGDRKLAQSAQMYHYQHQKQQMIALERANGEMKPDESADESDLEETVGGDYTVYECPGLAPAGEMEVKNPLFHGDNETPSEPTTLDEGDAAPYAK